MHLRKNTLLSGVAIGAVGCLFATLPTTNASFQDVRSGQLSIQVVIPEPLDPQPSLRTEQSPLGAPVVPVQVQPVPEVAPTAIEPQPVAQSDAEVPIESPSASPTSDPVEVLEVITEAPSLVTPSDESIIPPIEEEEEVHETNTP